MKNEFIKFPTTPHLATLPGVNIRQDKVLTESQRDEFLRHKLTVEEKVDGANLGISFDAKGNVRVQNRGNYLHLPSPGQWKKLSEWLTPRTDVLSKHLTDQYILFGEWCYAQHSIFYNHLPDWFLAFDIYDRRSCSFLASISRDKLLKKMPITKVPCLAPGQFTYPEIKNFLSQSKLTDQLAEGIYLRIDQGDHLAQRAKLVRPAFIQAIEQHWSLYTIKPNQLHLGFQGE